MAAMSSRCCLNLMTDSNSIPLAKSYTLRVKIDEKKRKPKLGMSLACAVIGALEMAISSPNIDLITSHGDTAMATEIVIAGKWSDRRRCPSWKTNALETVVPENLPRPSAHRSSEAVAFVAPDLIIRGCFTM